MLKSLLVLSTQSSESDCFQSLKENEYSRYQHLGKAETTAHINGVLAVVRRVQIDEFTKAIDGLRRKFARLILR